MKRVEVTVRPQPCIVDRTLRFYEREGTPVDKIVRLPARRPPHHLLRAQIEKAEPKFGTSETQSLNTLQDTEERFVYCTDRAAHLWWRDEDELLLSMKVPESPRSVSFYIVVYTDRNFFKTIAVYLLEVHGLKCEYVSVCVGQSVDRVFYAPPLMLQDAQKIRIYSSEPEVVVPQKAVDVEPGGAKFRVAIATVRKGHFSSRLHAVDPVSRRLLAAWIVLIVSEAPEVKETLEVNLPLNMAVRKRLPYRNAATRPVKYVVKSSDPTLVLVQNPEILMQPLESRFIELVFHEYAGSVRYESDVFLFIWSEDRSIQECRMLRLCYG